MVQATDTLDDLFRRHLELESATVDALESLNNRMASVLRDAGIAGPTLEALESLKPLVDTLQHRYRETSDSRRELTRRDELRSTLDASEGSKDLRLKYLMARLPAANFAELNAERKRVNKQLAEAQQKLTANQVSLFYSMEFHRRYLMGVLNCEQDDPSYQADGQATKVAPEKLFGRNC